MGSVDLENLKTNVRNKMLEAYKQKGLDFALKLARVVRDRNLATMLPSSDAANNVRGELCEAVAEICIVDYMNKLVDKITATLPSTHHIRKVTVRTEDFKRTGSMKVARV